MAGQAYLYTWVPFALARIENCRCNSKFRWELRSHERDEHEVRKKALAMGKNKRMMEKGFGFGEGKTERFLSLDQISLGKNCMVVKDFGAIVFLIWR